MEKYENNQIRETTDDIIAHELANERNDSTFIEEYLKTGFLSTAVDALYHARRQADLTQTQIAEHLNTKQASIARLEADTNGSLTLRRYVEFALACGMVPLDITLAPIDSVRDFVRNHPNLPLTQELYRAWIKTKVEVRQDVLLDPEETLSVQTAKSFTPPTNRTTSTHEVKQAVRFVEQFLKDQRKENDVLSKLPNENITMCSEFQTFNTYHQEGSQPSSTVNQAKVMAP